MPIAAIVVEPLVGVDERAADEQADRLQAERDRPGRAADPTQQRVGRVGRPQRDVHDEDHRLGDPGDDRDASRTGTSTATATTSSDRPMHEVPADQDLGDAAAADPPRADQRARRRSRRRTRRGSARAPTARSPRSRVTWTVSAGHERREQDRGRAPEQDRAAQDRARRRCSRCLRGSPSRAAAAGRSTGARRSRRTNASAERRQRERDARRWPASGRGRWSRRGRPAMAGPTM